MPACLGLACCSNGTLRPLLLTASKADLLAEGFLNPGLRLVPLQPVPAGRMRIFAQSHFYRNLYK
jgi:hypothetical protein